jgi:fatty-acyl-CoA synthase
VHLLIGDIFTNAARSVPQRTAAVHGDASLSYAELEARANQAARALMRLGVGLGDRVASWSTTGLDAVPAFAAVAKTGAAFGPANANLALDEATEMIGAAQPSVVLVDEERAEPGAELAARLGIPSVRISGLAGGAPVPGPGHGLAELAASEDTSRVRVDGLTEAHPHVVFFTSGSTGRSKGVVLSHRVNLLRTHTGAQLEPRGALVCMYPLFHMGAWTLALQQWQARDTLVLTQASGEEVCEAVSRHRAARLNCIPSVWQRVLDYLATPEGARVDTSSVRFADSGTSATPLSLLQAIEAAFPNAWLRIFYGSTESGNVATLEHPDIARKPGSCGVPSQYQEVRIDRANGELLTHSPVLFDGYFGDPEATAAAFEDGWYRTGDLAEVDDEGYLSIVGRARDVIRTGGETVSPSQVEELLAAHPAIADVAVVGIPDERWGEVVCAAVVLRAGAAGVELADLRGLCAGRLATFKHPRRVAVVDEIPRTASTNQVRRRVLVERITAAGVQAVGTSTSTP